MSFTYQNTTKLKGKPEYNFNDVSVQCYTFLYTHITFNQNDKFLFLIQYEKVFSLVEFFHSIFKYCSCSVTRSCPTLCDPMDCSIPGLPVPHHLLEFVQVHVHWISDVIQPSHPLLPSSPTSVFPSIRVLSSESALSIRWPRIGTSASASVLPMSIQGWFPLGLTCLISLLSKGLSRFFSSILSFLWSNSHPYMNTENTIVFTIWTCVSKVMFLLFNKLSRFFIDFLPRKNSLLISWMQSQFCSDFRAQ